MALSDNMVHLTQQPTLVRKLAPAPDRASVLVSTPDQIRCKKKINFTPYASPPASVARRNARERNRVKQVNNGFATLREHIPSSVAATVTGTGRGASKKLSKVDTLRMAVEYIRNLQQLLDENDSDASSTITSSDQNLSYYPESPSEMGHMVHHTPPCSEASVSPTPSFTSETTPYPQQKPSYQNESFENYEPMSPEDEELLDVIWWWQQQ